MIAAIAVAGAVAGRSAQPASPAVGKEVANGVIELPTFTVEDSRVLPKPEKWRYARIEGFEILSNTSDSAATRLVKDFQRFHQALVLAWPPADIPSAVPVSLILCGRDNAYDAFKAQAAGDPNVAEVSMSRRDAEMSAIIIDLEATTLNLMTSEALEAAMAEMAAPVPAAGTDEASLPITSGLPDFVVDHYRQLYREYIRFVLSQVTPRAPAWLEEGISQIFMKMEFSPTSILVGRVEDPNTTSIGGVMEDRDFNVALRRRALMPMDKFFAVTHDSPTARNPLGSLWAKQAYAFVHYCLYGNNLKYQKALILLLNKSGSKPPTEELFKECFGMSYKDMLIQIRSYAEFTSYKAVRLKPLKGQRFPEPAKPVFRDATPGEIGRIKGEALRLAGKDDLARDTLIAPYIRGDRDPQLLASIGLYERSVHHDERARKFLEAAAQAEVARPRAYLELARLRFGEALARPSGLDGKFSEGQVASILRPLFVARTQQPPLVEVYETIAATWDRSATPPTAGNLEVIDEGLRRFYTHSAWVYQAAQLKLHYGLLQEAAVVADLGWRTTRDPEQKERFAQLKASLPPLPPRAVKAPENEAKGAPPKTDSTGSAGSSAPR